MPLKAFFFLLRDPGLAEVEAFRSLIFEEQEQMRRGSSDKPSVEENKNGENENKSERR